MHDTFLSTFNNTYITAKTFIYVVIVRGKLNIWGKCDESLSFFGNIIFYREICTHLYTKLYNNSLSFVLFISNLVQLQLYFILNRYRMSDKLYRYYK